MPRQTSAFQVADRNNERVLLQKLVESSGFATMPGSKKASADVARACAEILTKAPTPRT